MVSSSPSGASASVLDAENSLFSYQSWYGIWFCIVMIWTNWFLDVAEIVDNVLRYADSSDT